MRRALVAFTVAFLLGLAFAFPAQASSYLYRKHCSPRSASGSYLGALDAYTWVHQSGTDRWTSPWATPIHTKGKDYSFAWFDMEGQMFGYEHPVYRWPFGYYHRIKVYWVDQNGAIVSCTITVVH